MSLDVIGAGYGRTGTMSLKIALERLGYGPCYHMYEVFDNPGHIPLWDAAIEGQSSDWRSTLENNRAVVDWPTTYYWRELADLYLRAKIILTVREAEAWYASISQTIFATQARSLPADDPLMRDGIKTARKLMQRTFDGRTQEASYVIQVYEQHNQAVQSLVE
jgi:hypothetical protein